jgi:exodeoxyribonuclease V beta subunit
MAESLQAIGFPLWGSRLIEASAGTGKTWTIAALYVRLVLGHGGPQTRFVRPLMPADILVMTFTRAATRELSDRIRARLIEAARCFREESTPKAEDSFLKDLLADYPEEKERRHAAWRLAMAAECMDEASVFTIDAWAQRMLREHAFDSGSLFDEELVADEKSLLSQAVQDYWRRQCYPLSGDALPSILSVWSGVDALLADVRDLLGKQTPREEPTGQLIDVVEDARLQREQALQALRRQWVEHVPVMRSFVQSQDPPKAHGWDGRKFSIANITKWLDTLQRWAEGEDEGDVPALATGWTRLLPSGLEQARSPGAGSADMAPQEALAFEAFATLQDQLQRLPRPQDAARLHAAQGVAARLRELKRHHNQFGFADMLERLERALHGVNGERLRERILQQYPVALIDEFQDTAPIQYGIFDSIYRTQDNDPARALLLIGDPKQSIYGFRGADIYSYLRARQATQDRHYVLSVNYRSTSGLVDAVNRCFEQAEQKQPEGAFDFKSGQDNPLPFLPVEAKGRAERWVNGDRPMPALTIVHDLQTQSMGLIRRAFAERCAEQVVRWLNDPQNGFSREGKPLERLRARDIAILVRTGKEAVAVRKALQKRNIASVYLSDKDSVFDSDEARDLAHWLQAVATPQEASLVRAGLALGSLGLSMDELLRVASDDLSFDAHVQTLRELRQVWVSQGVLAMLRKTLHRFDLASRWLSQSAGERRLTNFLHLAELLQHASADLEGEQALIRWLVRQTAEGADSNEEQVVRLESDADLVKVVTVHKSKGLEYPVVLVPFATSFRGFDARLVKSAMLANADGSRELVLHLDEDAQAVFEQERMREDLRLLYVAMTRPRHALWMGFGAVRVGNGKSDKTHLSAIGRLIGGPIEREGPQWQQVLEALAERCPDIELQEATERTEVSLMRTRDDACSLQATPPYQGQFDKSWSIASYSRLTRDLKRENLTPAAGPVASEDTQLSPLQIIRPADDEIADETTAVDESTLMGSRAFTVPLTGAVGEEAAAPAIWHSFKRGPVTGNFLHELLEWICSESFDLKGNDSLIARLVSRCQREDHGAVAHALVEWMTDIVHQPLPELGVSLSELQSVRSEMEFWLPLRSLGTARVDQLCRQHLMPGIPRPELQASELHGMLMGFMDLVFEHNGRYWVLDYKSNALGQTDSAYDVTALQQAMADHRYDVQAALYALALHRLLKSRMGPRYDPDQHLGGAVYLFIRGIHGPASGTCTLTMSRELIEALEGMLEPVNAELVA